VPAYDAVSYKRVNDSTWWAIETKAGKVVGTLIMVLSPDGKTNTVTVMGVGANGQPIYNVAVYDKQ
jgi:VCBS repeat-containing protein